MSTTMPEFEMPDVVPPPPVAAIAGAPPARAGDPASPTGTGTDAPTVVAATDLTAEPDPVAAPLPAPRPRIVWRQVLAAALVGAIVGAGVPAAVQAVGRAAAAADADALRALASDYLAAIADRRADDATALVPVTPEAGGAVLAPAALLAAARPIARTEVRLVHIEGDAGSVEVRYRAGGSDVFRTLDAERAGGRWRLTTSLTETVHVYSMDSGALVALAGMTVESGSALLYPGTYVPERNEGPVVTTRVDSFVVDGDPRTPTEAYASTELAPALMELAAAHAVASVDECQRAGSCPEADGAVPGPVDYVHITSSDLAQGVLDLIVPLSSASPSAPWLELRVQLTVDPDGQPVSWLCGRPGHFEGELAPCPALG